MGRNKKVKKPLVTGDESDIGSDVNEEVPQVVEHQEAPAETQIEAEGEPAEDGKKGKKLSKKALERMEQQKRATEAPAPKKGKGKKKRGDTSSDDEEEKVEAVPEPDSASESESESEDDGELTYPLKITYCPNCTFPIEMCEFSGMFDKCKPFLIELLGEEAVANISDKGRKRKIATEAEKLEAMLAKDGKNKLEKHVVMEVKNRGNRSHITYVRGADLFGINLKDFCKDLKKAFAAGAGVSSEAGKLDAIEVQGDFVDQIGDILMKRFNVPKDALYKQEGKGTFPLFGERPQKAEADDKKKKKASGKMAIEQQAPDFEGGDRVTKAKMVVAEKREKVVKAEPEPRGRLFGPKVSTRGGGAGAAGRGGCFNCGQEGHLSRDCPVPKAPRGGGGIGRGGDAGARGRGDARGRGTQ